MSETKRFHIGDVITITDGHLVSPRHIAGVYDICEWVTGEEGLMTHQLSRVSREIEPFLTAQFPALAAVEFPGGLSTEEAILGWLATLYPEHGEYVEVPQMAPEDHTRIDPISELKMLRPDAPSLTVREQSTVQQRHETGMDVRRDALAVEVTALRSKLAEVRAYAEDRAFHAKGHLNTVNSGRIATDLLTILDRESDRDE